MARRTRTRSSPVAAIEMFDRITNAELASFLRGAAEAERRKAAESNEDAATWAHTGNAERFEIAAKRVGGIVWR